MKAKLFDELRASTNEALAHAKRTKRLTTTRRKMKKVKRVRRGR